MAVMAEDRSPFDSEWISRRTYKHNNFPTSLPTTLPETLFSCSETIISYLSYGAQGIVIVVEVPEAKVPYQYVGKKMSQKARVIRK